MWASTLARSDFKVRREASFFTVVGLSHAENVARFAPGRIANDHEASGEQAIANDATLTVVFACVVNLNSGALKNMAGIFEVETARFKCAQTLR